ncbi:MAG: hypothetical protein GXO04_03450 [Aquificae bacterium]|nr:hypothetical protein [Aquificota bacterium]
MNKRVFLEAEILRELSELDFYTISAPLNTKEFWSEWQEKYTRASLTRIALRNIARSRRLSRKELFRVRNLLRKYDDIIAYLNNLKLTALSARGYGGGYYIEFGEEDEEGGQ